MRVAAGSLQGFRHNALEYQSTRHLIPFIYSVNNRNSSDPSLILSQSSSITVSAAKAALVAREPVSCGTLPVDDNIIAIDLNIGDVVRRQEDVHACSDERAR
jgi:hypothetical protein